MNTGKIILRLLSYLSFSFILVQIYAFVDIPQTLEYIVPYEIFVGLSAIYVFYDIFFD